MDDAQRHAVYWAPEPAHPLWRAGCAWLGRDPFTDVLGRPPPNRAEPWRYGFHATLKPPMALHEGADTAAFIAEVRALAARTPRFAMPALEVAWLAGFLALRPVQPLGEPHPLRRLADTCVTALDRWRAPASPETLTRRLADPSLDEEQSTLVQRWGYAHVLARWRFHMTLTDTLPADDEARRRRLMNDAKAHFTPALAEPLEARSLCVFVEPRAGAPLRLACRLPLAP